MWRMTILSELLFLHVRGEPVVVVDRDIVIGMQERCPDRNQIKSHRATEPPSLSLETRRSAIERSPTRLHGLH